MKKLKTDVVIVGAGPAGMSMALYLKRANINFLLLEKGAPGGKLNNISNIDNILGIDSIQGPNLAFNMFNQISKLGISILNEEVIDIKDNFIVSTNESTIECKIVVLATGMSNKKVNIPNYDKLLHKGISSCAICDGFLYKNKKIAVIGNNEIAHKEYEYLKGLTSSIIFIDNKDEKVIEFIGNDHLTNIKTNKAIYEVDGAFIYTDEILNDNLLKNYQIEVFNSRLKVDQNFMSNINNIYAIGDVINKAIYQVVGAMNDASVASMSIIKKLR